MFKFLCDPLINKGTFLGVESIFSYVSRLPNDIVSKNFISLSLYAWNAEDARFVTIGQKLWEFYSENKVLFRLFLVIAGIILLKINPSHSPRMPYSCRNFARYLSIN